MLVSQQRPWRLIHDLIANGTAVGVWRASVWRRTTEVVLEGRTYRVRHGGRDLSFRMTDAGGEVVAATRLTDRHWTVDAETANLRFRTVDELRGVFELHDGAAALGAVRRVTWRGHDFSADLPGVALHVQAFVVVVLSWNLSVGWDA